MVKTRGGLLYWWELHQNYLICLHFPFEIKTWAAVSWKEKQSPHSRRCTRKPIKAFFYTLAWKIRQKDKTFCNWCFLKDDQRWTRVIHTCKTLFNLFTTDLKCLGLEVWRKNKNKVKKFPFCLNLHFTFSWVFFERDGKRLSATAAVLTQTYLWAFSFCTGGKQRLRISSFNRHHSDHLSSWLPRSTAWFSTFYFNFPHFSLTFSPAVSLTGQC